MSLKSNKVPVRHIRYGLLFIGSLIASSLVFFPFTVSAATPGWGRGEYYGYFDNVLRYWGYNSGATADSGYVLQPVYQSFTEAFPSTTDTVPEFINFLQTTYAFNFSNRSMVSFIVHTMLGRNGPGGGRSVSAADWADLNNRLNGPGITISWNEFHFAVHNTYHQTTANASSLTMPSLAARASDANDVGWADGSQAGSAIIIRHNGTKVYALFRSCANPDGDLPGIPPPPVPVDNPPIGQVDPVTCSLVVSGWARDPDYSGSIEINIYVNGQFGQPGAAGYNAGQANLPRAGQGNTGFSYALPSGWNDGSSHTYYVYALGVDGAGNGNSVNTIIGSGTFGPCQNYDLRPSVITGTVNAEPGEAINFTYNVTNVGTTASPATTSVSVRRYIVPPNGTFTVTTSQDGVSNPTVVYGSNPNNTYQLPQRAFNVGQTTVNPSAPAGAPAYAPPNTAALAPGTRVCEILAVDPATATIGNRWSAPTCITIVNKPYFKVYGGDAAAGAVYGPTCAGTSFATIRAFNKGAAGGYAGSGTQVATFATMAIQDFVSASGRAGAPVSPIGLTFANNPPGTFGFGGTFSSPRCIPDFWANATGINNGYSTPGNGLTVVGPGTQTVIYVQGDAYVNRNVVFTGGGASWNLNNLPAYWLIVRGGNIYVKDTVSQLDGVYIAMPDAGVGGTIYTCAVDNGSGGLRVPTGQEMSSSCRTQLRVNGSFIANRVRLLRTANSLIQSAVGESVAATRAAEVFSFTPEVWLNSPVTVPSSTGGTGAGVYDSITSMPPVL